MSSRKDRKPQSANKLSANAPSTIAPASDLSPSPDVELQAPSITPNPYEPQSLPQMQLQYPSAEQKAANDARRALEEEEAKYEAQRRANAAGHIFTQEEIREQARQQATWDEERRARNYDDFLHSRPHIPTLPSPELLHGDIYREQMAAYRQKMSHKEQGVGVGVGAATHATAATAPAFAPHGFGGSNSSSSRSNTSNNNTESHYQQQIAQLQRQSPEMQDPEEQRRAQLMRMGTPNQVRDPYEQPHSNVGYQYANPPMVSAPQPPVNQGYGGYNAYNAYNAYSNYNGDPDGSSVGIGAGAGVGASTSDDSDDYYERAGGAPQSRLLNSHNFNGFTGFNDFDRDDGAGAGGDSAMGADATMADAMADDIADNVSKLQRFRVPDASVGVSGALAGLGNTAQAMAAAEAAAVAAAASETADEERNNFASPFHNKETAFLPIPEPWSGITDKDLKKVEHLKKIRERVEACERRLDELFKEKVARRSKDSPAPKPKEFLEPNVQPSGEFGMWAAPGQSTPTSYEQARAQGLKQLKETAGLSSAFSELKSLTAQLKNEADEGKRAKSASRRGKRKSDKDEEAPLLNGLEDLAANGGILPSSQRASSPNGLSEEEIKPKQKGQNFSIDDLIKAIEIRSGIKASEVEVDPFEIYAMRKTEAVEVAQEVARRKEAHYRSFITNMIDEGNIRPEWNFDTLKQDKLNCDAFASAYSFLSSINAKLSNTMLLIFGDYGTGKTLLCHAVANQYLRLKAQHHQRSTRNPDLPMVMVTSFDQVRRTWLYSHRETAEDKQERERRFMEFCNVDLLILDGLCHDNVALDQFNQKIFNDLLRRRSSQMLPIVISTPINLQSIHKAIGDLCYEGMRCFDVIATALLGGSRRPFIKFNGSCLP